MQYGRETSWRVEMEKMVFKQVYSRLRLAHLISGYYNFSPSSLYLLSALFPAAARSNHPACFIVYVHMLSPLSHRPSPLNHSLSEQPRFASRKKEKREGMITVDILSDSLASQRNRLSDPGGRADGDG